VSSSSPPSKRRLSGDFRWPRFNNVEEVVDEHVFSFLPHPRRRGSSYGGTYRTPRLCRWNADILAKNVVCERLWRLRTGGRL
jgi:hypothetical protein